MSNGSRLVSCIVALVLAAGVAIQIIANHRYNEVETTSLNVGSRIYLPEVKHFGTIVGFAVINGETYPMIKEDPAPIFITTFPEKDTM